MANETIYPYGQGQTMPAGYPIADDLVTNSAQIALSARQGKNLGITVNGRDLSYGPSDMEAKKYSNGNITVGDTHPDTASSMSGWLSAKIPIIAGDVVTIANGYVDQNVRAFAVTDNQLTVLYITEKNATANTTYTALQDGFVFVNIHSGGSTLVLTVKQDGHEQRLEELEQFAENGAQVTKTEQLSAITGAKAVVSGISGKGVSAYGLLGVKSEMMRWLKESDVQESENIYDERYVIDGYHLTNSTTPVIEQSAGCKLFIHPLPEGCDRITLVQDGSMYQPLKYVYLVLLDDNLDVTTKTGGQISYLGAERSTFSMDVSASDEYVAFCVYDTSMYSTPPTKVVCITGHKYEFSTNSAVIRQYVDYCLERTRPDLEDAVEGGQVNYFSGEYLVSSNGSASNWDFEIPTNGGEYVTWYCERAIFGYINNGLIEYDSENTELLNSGITSTISTTTWFSGDGSSVTHCRQFRLDPNCKKLRIRLGASLSMTYNELPLMYFPVDFIRKQYGVKLFVNNNRVVDWGPKYLNSINGSPILISKPKIDGRVIVTYGDSITANNGGYPWQIQTRYNCAVWNYAKGNAWTTDIAGTVIMDTDTGSGKVTTEKKNVLSNHIRWSIRELKENGVHPDIAIIGGAGNDSWNNQPLGTLTTTMSNYPLLTDVEHTNFFDSLSYAVSKLRDAFPYITIYFATPIRQLSGGTGQRHDEYVQAFKDAAFAFGVPLIDFEAEARLTPYPEDYSQNPYYGDSGGHPSRLGRILMAGLAVGRIDDTYTPVDWVTVSGDTGVGSVELVFADNDISNASLKVTTDADGKYSIRLWRTHSYTISAAGYTLDATSIKPYSDIVKNLTLTAE